MASITFDYRRTHMGKNLDRMQGAIYCPKIMHGNITVNLIAHPPPNYTRNAANIHRELLMISGIAYVQIHACAVNSVPDKQLHEVITMSILAKIFDKIFPWADGKSPSPAKPTIEQHNDAAAQTTGNTTATPTTNQKPTSAPISDVDVEKILNALASKNAQQLNWRTSIVDLLKLLDLDSSLQARKELAAELEYSGDDNDSAAMNIWLHREVMKTLAANGGTVPADLRD